MRNWILTFFIFFITSNFLAAQNLEVMGKGNNLYIEHPVAPKESLYSVGRLFNISPKDIAAYNKISLETGLNIGQVLKIPLAASNFTQTQKTGGGEVLVPVYHTVAPEETLYRLGVNYNKVPLASLKKWNKLSSDAVSVGSSMIVGFLKVDKKQSALASQKSAPVVNEIVDVPKEKAPVEEKKAEIVAVKEAPVKPEIKEEILEKKETPKETVTNTKQSINFGGGYFKKLYDQQMTEQSPENMAGNSGVFKSTSGWQDGKYYCFNDKATPGSIIKITDNTTGKSVYAKVLDAIPEIKQNDGLNIIISNAAAEELETGADKFSCTLTYVK